MSNERTSSETMRARLKLLQNPYAFIDFEEETPEESPRAYSFEQKRAYFKTLENPHAHQAIFGDLEEESRPNDVGTNHPGGDAAISKADLEKMLDEVLAMYKPYVARTDWAQVMDYRSKFLDAASRTSVLVQRVAERLRKLKFSLRPDEKVEFNRAPAARIIGELEKLLT